MTGRASARAVWHGHVNGVNPPSELRHWLCDSGSLTVKLSGCSGSFRVHRLCQRQALCLADEVAALGLHGRRCVQQREVLLVCDGRPVVYAHTVVPLSASAADWPFFRGLAERSLGTMLFGDPRVYRDPLQFARLRPAHPLAQRARRAAGLPAAGAPLHARRCLYRRRRGALLVTEVFLPQIVRLGLPEQATAAACPSAD